MFVRRRRHLGIALGTILGSAALAGLTSAATCIQGQEDAAQLEPESIERLGKGTVSLKLQQGRGVLDITLDVQLPDIASIQVEGEGGRPIARFTSTPPATTREGAPGLPTLSIEGEPLSGALRLRVQEDLSHAQHVRLALVRTDGLSLSFGLFSRTTVANIGAKWVFSEAPCYTVQLECQGCSISRTCCTVRKDVCADCIQCTIACPPCSMPPY
jgi:hypothetical protein